MAITKLDAVFLEGKIFKDLVGDRKQATRTDFIAASFEDLSGPRHASDIGVLLQDQDLVILVGQNLRGSHAVVARTDDNRIIFFSHISLQHLQGA